VAAPTYTQQPVAGNTSNSLSTIAIILGVIGLLFVPMLFGTAGLVLGIVAKSKKEPRANVAIAIGIIGLVGGIILGAIVGAATFGY
jgi:CheY-specific phosphatase CheX